MLPSMQEVLSVTTQSNRRAQEGAAAAASRSRLARGPSGLGRATKRLTMHCLKGYFGSAIQKMTGGEERYWYKLTEGQIRDHIGDECQLGMI